MDEIKYVVTFMAIVLSIGLGVWVVKSHFEKETFNKFSDHDKQATLVDAMFAQLRVEASND